jgi:hypothetical protein
LARSGRVDVCFVEDFGCRREAGERALRVPASRTIESEVVRHYLGFPGKPQSYGIVIMPPRP